LVSDTLEAALSTGGDFAEVFAEERTSTGAVTLNGAVERASWSAIRGLGIRVYSGFGAVYAYTNDLSRESLVKMAKEASIAAGEKKETGFSGSFERLKFSGLHPIEVYPAGKSKREYAERLRLAYEAAKGVSALVTEVGASYGSYTQNVLIANSDGLWAEDERTRTRVIVEAIATNAGEKQVSTRSPGAHKGLEFFGEIDIEEMARGAAESACRMLGAQLCPAGQMPVLIDNAFGGVIFHEACGHSLEATLVARNASVFSGKLGTRIASDIVTAIDDGTIPNAWGSLNIDDEGTKTRKNVLIENGILKSYMIDKLNARRMGLAPTGSSRRESYEYAPTSRMTNTYIAPGTDDINEMIASTEYGLYCKKMGGGSVQPSTGDFNFAVLEAYMIRGGKISEPVRGATLIGKGSEVLLDIDRIAGNLALGEGMCGSLSGAVPTCVGQPMIRVKKMTVGGRR
jgi:TldD protein